MGDGTSSSTNSSNSNSNSANSFLKNLSQKKYSWMQPSTTIGSIPISGSTTASSTSTGPAMGTFSSTTAATGVSNRPKEASNNSEQRSNNTKTDDRPAKRSRQTKRASSQDTENNQKSAKSSPSRRSRPSSSQRSSPATTSTAAADYDEEEEEEEEQQPVAVVPRRQSRRHQPRFKYTSFAVKGFNILPTRNITSTFDRTDATYFPGNKAGSQEIAPDPEEEWRDTIVIHPGSRNLRIGRSSDAFPKTVPHVIARRMKQGQQPKSGEDPTTRDVKAVAATAAAVNQNEEKESSPSGERGPVSDVDMLNFNNRDEALKEIKNELKWRMKAAKRRAVPNAEGQVIGFNTQAYQETIPDHNDPYKVEWTELKPGQPVPEYFVGEKALNLPITQYPEYRLFYPWKHGTLNDQDYDSIEACLGDLQAIWTETIRSELDVHESSFENYNAVLVVPDLFNRRYTCELITMMLRYMNFRAVCVQQESTSATFGAGVSSACVVDIGAQKTSIACIEDGVCLTDSRTSIAIGGDDITKTFASFLLANRFPYAEIDLSKAYDWRLAEELKEKWCTMNEADISVQVYDFFVRTPRQPTKKYQCKVYDEVFLAPLCLLYPAILNAGEKTENAKAWANPNIIDDIAAEEASSVAPVTITQHSAVQRINTPQQSSSEVSSEASSSTPVYQQNNNNGNSSSLGAETPAGARIYDVYPIDVAIAQSIQAASGASDERLKRFFTNIILVGGGGMISNFNRVLEDRLLSTVIAQRANIEHVEVLPAPRELDPRLLMWKGASVLSKLDIAKELWIGEEEWNEVGARCLRERALFI